jgi:hypothetical protein
MRAFILTVSRKGDWTDHVMRMAESRREYRVVVGTETAGCREEDNSKVDRKEMGKVGVRLIWLWTETGRRFLVNMVMDYRLHQHQQMHYSEHIAYFTYLLTPWSRVLLEKLTGFAASQ